LNRSEETTVRSWPSAVWPGKICPINAEGNFCKAKAKESGAGERLSRYQSQQGDKYATTNSTRWGIDDGPLRADHRRHFMLYRATRASGVLIPWPYLMIERICAREWRSVLFEIARLLLRGHFDLLSAPYEVTRVVYQSRVFTRILN